MQLENLRLTDDVADIFYLNGPIEVEVPDPALGGLIYGPFFSWVDPEDTACGGSGGEDIKGGSMCTSQLVVAVQHVLAAVQEYGKR